MPRKSYPVPLVISPVRNEHTHTIIALHGRGSNAERFGREILASANLQNRLPTVKFVFPTASKRRSTILKRVPINQWYDNYSLDDPGERTDLQIEGLCETAEFLRDLITNEAHILGAGGYRKIILWGLSQGCAAGIFTVLGGWGDNSTTNAIGAFVGMSGWLPFEQHLKEILRCDDDSELAGDNSRYESQSDDHDGDDRDISSDEDLEKDEWSDSELEDDLFHQPGQPNDDFNPFMEEEEETDIPPAIQAVNYIRDILDLPMLSTDEESPSLSPKDPLSPSNLYQLQIPIFIGHGAEDPKVSVRLGEKMSQVLSKGLGMDLTWKSYEGLGHWYRAEDEIQDILKFLQTRVNLPVEDDLPVSNS
ncbi:Phospholipase/carboxylesterase/thioesterase [Penicillium verhagenii]|uniref:Phospholipase/carboxylesterase/thioesterase n=1 Tax=Penicillium verhagenii TaxID=1562060 RepID=UPI002545A0CA|nr:Phospholipase/carboxylesterase/thioesterase [Penicillium verhagenii]KAJ5930873.1 Phospholipase/carboxylesterase/thioesterase [Penicillium verhagenii]